MLRGVFGTNSIVDLLRSEGGVDHDGFTSKYCFDIFKKFRKALQVGFFCIIGGVVQCPVVSVGEFFKGEVFS
jgi:hypothetical protein